MTHDDARYHQESKAELVVALVAVIGLIVVPVVVLAVGLWCWFRCG